MVDFFTKDKDNIVFLGEYNKLDVFRNLVLNVELDNLIAFEDFNNLMISYLEPIDTIIQKVIEKNES